MGVGEATMVCAADPTLLTLVIYLRITSAAGFEVADYESAHDFLEPVFS
jgi:hypothetical protein